MMDVLPAIMDELHCSLDPRSFQALLNGLSKNLLGEESFSTEYFAEHLYKSESEDFLSSNEIESFQAVLGSAASGKWTVDALSKHLHSRSLKAEFVQVFLNFWTKESERVS
jgi:hypothetical protein